MNKLEQICATKREEVAARKRMRSLADLDATGPAFVRETVLVSPSGRRVVLPMPADPMLIRPGLALHKATRSFTVLAGWASLPISKLGVTPTRQIGTKSCSTE